MSKLKELQEEECKLEMTPMIDVTFLLLIFFMCTLKFKTLEGKLAAHLPKDVGVNTMEAEPIEKVEITMRVRNPGTRLEPRKSPSDPAEPWDGQGRFEFDNDRVVEYSIGPQKTRDLRVVERRLKELFELDSERPATIDPRPGKGEEFDVVYSDVVEILDLCIGAGFEKITFVGAYPEKN